jgi:quercetin dioxygenase-like cupin family protein
VNVILSALLLLQIPSPVLENDYVAVHKNAAPCASAQSQCGDRVIVALGTISFEGSQMQRGEVRIFNADESYAKPQGGEFVEVVLKTDRPPVMTSAETIVPDNYNVILHEGKRFRVIEGRLRPGDTRDRHTHNQRLIVYINATRLRQWPDGEPERIVDFIADNINFAEPTTHRLENIGSDSVRNIVIEFKP